MKASSTRGRRRIVWGTLACAPIVALLWWALGPVHVGVPRVPCIDTFQWLDKTAQLYVAIAADSSTIYIAAEHKGAVGTDVMERVSAPIMTGATLPIVEYDLLTGVSRTVPPETWATLDSSYSKIKVMPFSLDSDVYPKPPRWETSADGRALFCGVKPAPMPDKPHPLTQDDLLRAGAKRIPLTGAVPLPAGAMSPGNQYRCLVSAAGFHRRPGGLLGEGSTREYVGPVTVNFANSFTGEVSPHSFVLAGSLDKTHLQSRWSSDGRFALIMERGYVCLWIIDASKVDLPGRSE